MKFSTEEEEGIEIKAGSGHAFILLLIISIQWVQFSE